MGRIKLPKYRAVTVSMFWDMVSGGYMPPRRCFLIMKDGIQDWGYPMNYSTPDLYGGRVWFDHHRQGAHHNQDDIEFVLIPK